MKRKTIILGMVLLIACTAFLKKDDLIKKAFDHAQKQTRVMLKEVAAATEKAKAENKTEPFSPRTIKNGELAIVASGDWTSGFFPGVLWYLYEFTKDARWKTEAEKFTARMEKEKLNGRTHDMGFKMYCSYGTGYRLNKDERYKDILVQSAQTLSTRFKPNAGILRSWDHSRDKWDCPVIIDNMMNLELLFFATRVTGDSSFHKIAVSHAKTTMKNHFRPDNSSYHVLDYDTVTGKVMKKHTHQGYAHESAWARGQAWGLYGYTLCYRETKDKSFLDQAEKIAAFIFAHPNLPKDLVPYWDFNAPNIPNEERDASAAAVTASALYELSLYSKNKKDYVSKANTIVANLAKNYISPVGENKGFILLHSTGSKPGKSEVDVPLNYADYYYLEALLRKQKLERGSNLF